MIYVYLVLLVDEFDSLALLSYEEIYQFIVAIKILRSSQHGILNPNLPQQKDHNTTIAISTLVRVRPTTRTSNSSK
jgi:hypothetical protein